MIVRLTEFAFVSASECLPDPAYSFADDWETTIYSLPEFAEALRGVHWLNTPSLNAGWDTWNATWRHQDQFVSLDMLACDIDPDNDMRPGLSQYWGGSTIDACCELSRFLDLWRTIRARCPAVCIHNTDCRLYTPDQFHNINTNTNINTDTNTKNA